MKHESMGLFKGPKVMDTLFLRLIYLSFVTPREGTAIINTSERHHIELKIKMATKAEANHLSKWLKQVSTTPQECSTRSHSEAPCV
jgi:hypothetical protein